MPKKIILTSSGLENSDLTEKALLGLLSKTPAKTHVCIVPTAGYPEIKQSRVDERLSELSRLGFRDIAIVDLKHEDASSLRSKLTSIDLLIVGGGNTFWLLDWIRKTSFTELVNELIAQGTIYFGVSAGSYIACPTIDPSAWMNDGDFNVSRLTDLTALNLVPFYVVAHCNDSNASKVTNGAKSTTLPVAALRDGQAIMVNGGTISFVGDGERVLLNDFENLL